jgi:hypothetical protein
MIFSEYSLDAREHYEAQGFIHLRMQDSVFSGLCEQARLASTSMLKNPASRRRRAFFTKEGVARHVVDIARIPHTPFRAVIEFPPLKAIYKGILGGDRAIFTHSKLSYKIPGKASDWYPHQDNGYKLFSRSYIRKGFAIFIFLEDIRDEDGALQVLPGSHRGGTLPHAKRIENAAMGDYQIVVEELPPIEPLTVSGMQGDVLLFHGDTIHQSGPTLTQSNRLAIIAEVETFTSLKLDDHSKVPLFPYGSLTVMERSQLTCRSLFNPYRIWGVARNYGWVVKLARQLRGLLSRS